MIYSVNTEIFQSYLTAKNKGGLTSSSSSNATAGKQFNSKGPQMNGKESTF
mgnify:CR=1 FL=1